MGNEQSGAGGGGGTAGGANAIDKRINKGNHPPPLPLLAEAEKAQMKRHFPHAKRLYLSALESIIFYTGEDSIEAARCRVKVGEMCIQEKKFDEAIVYLRLALSSMETMRKDVNPKITPTQMEIKKLMGDIAFCEYNMAQRESRGSSNFNKLSIAALQKFQAISELDDAQAANGGQEVYVTELIGQDFSEKKGGGVFIPETGGQALESAMAGVNVHSDIGKAANGMQVAREAEDCVNAVRDTADDVEAQMEIRQTSMATPEVTAMNRRGGNRADCNLIVAALHANTNNPVAARKVLQSTAKMQRKRKVPVNATQRLAVGLDEQMRQLNALRLIQRGLMRIIRRIRIRKIFLLQRELFEEWEACMRDAIYEFEDDICYNWTGLEGDSRDTKLEEEALRYEMIRDEVDDLMIAETMDNEDLAAEEQMEFDLLMGDYQEFLADLEFAKKYNPEHWQNCINQLQDDEPADRAKIRKREQEEWDALMQMMRISAMGAKRKEDERHAAYARVNREINEGLDAGADHIRRQEEEEWQQLMKLHYEALINDLIEQERRARPKVVDLQYQRDFWRNLADDEEDERAAVKLLEERRLRALKLASEQLEREMMAALAKLQAEEQEAWNKLMRLQKKEIPMVLKKEAEGRKREEVQQRRASKVAPPRRRSSLGGTITELPDMTIPEVAEVVEVVPEAPLTPTEPAALKNRRRSIRAPDQKGATEETSHFLLEDDEQVQREIVDEIDATPSAAPVSPPVSVTPQETPAGLGGRRRTMVKRSGTTSTAAVEIDTTEGPDATPIEEDINTNLTTIQTRRRSVASVSPQATPIETPPAPPVAPQRRRSNPQMQKRGANRVEEATAALLDEDNNVQDIVEDTSDISGIKRRSSRSSVSPQQSQLSPIEPEVPPLPSSSPKQSDMRKRSSKNIRQRSGASSQMDSEVFLPEEEGQAIPDSEDNGPDALAAVPRRRASSVSPRDLTLAVGAGATAAAVVKRTASNTRRQSKRVVAGTTGMNEAALPEEEAPQSIDDSEADLPQTTFRRKQSSVSPSSGALLPPPPPPEVTKPKRAASARRQVIKRVGPSTTMSNEAVLPEEEVAETIEETDSHDLRQTNLRRRASSVSPPSQPLQAPSDQTAKRTASTARRQIKRVSSGTTGMNEATLPEEEVSQAIDESDSHDLSQANALRRRASSISPPAEAIVPPVVAGVAKRTASTRRTPKRTASGSTLANEATLPEEEAPQTIEETDTNDLQQVTAPRRRSLSVSPTTESIAPPEVAVAPIAATRRVASTRRAPKRSGGGTTQANEAALPEEEAPQAIEETDSQALQTTGLRRRGSAVSPGSRAISPHESADESRDSSSKTSTSRSKATSRRQLTTRTTTSGQTNSSEAVLIEEQASAQVEDSENNAGLGRRQRSNVGSQRTLDAAMVASDAKGIVDDEEGLVSMPKRQRNRRTSGGAGTTVEASAQMLEASVRGGGIEEPDGDLLSQDDGSGLKQVARRQRSKRGSGQGIQFDSAAATQEDEGHRVVDDLDHSRLEPTRKSTSGTNLVDAIHRTTFGEEVHSSDFGSPTSSQSKTGRGSRQRKGSSTTASVNADAFDDVSSSGIVEHDSNQLVVSSPPRAITPQEASNPRRVSGAPQEPTSPHTAIRRKESDAAEQRSAHNRLMSEVQLKEEGAALIKRLMVRVQRTKMFMMTPDDVETVRALFANCDENQNGVVSRDEFTSFAARVMELPNLTQRDVEGMFDKMDIDGSGNLSFAEFMELYRHLAMEEVARRDPALADAVKRGIPMKRRKSTNRAAQQVFAVQAAKVLGEEIDDDLAASLCVDQELMRTTTDWNNISSYVENRPSQIGNRRLEELKSAIEGKVTNTRNAIRRSRGRSGAGQAFDPSAAMVANDEAGALVEADDGAMVSKRRSSRRRDSSMSPAGSLSPVSPTLSRHRGSTQGTAAALLDDEEATAVEEEFESLRAQRQSNRNHRLLWDREDRPPWSLPALDELEHNNSVRDALSTSSRDDALKYLREMSLEKEKQNEELFKKYPFLDALPQGVPLSELGLESNAAIAALMARRKSTSSRNVANNAEVEKSIVSEVKKLATARSNALEAYAEKQGDFAVQVRELVASEKTQRRMSRRRSSLGKEVQSDSDSSHSDTDAIMQRMHEEREADINRRRQEILHNKEDEARRKADQEEALRRQRENDAHSLKAKNQRLRQAANNKAEAEGMIKRCIIRAGKAGASGEAELDVNDLTTIKSHFDNYDNEDAGAINRQQFLEFYMATFDGISSIAKKDIDDIFKGFASDGSELNFMEFVEVYKHVANIEIQKKEEKLGRKKSNVAGPSRVQSMAPRKPTTQRTQSNVRSRN